MTIWTGSFWKAAAERAVKTFAQALGAILVGSGIGLVGANWLDALNLAGMAALLSVLTSIASGGIGSNGPSLGAETLSAKVEAKTDPESPTGAVAGEASPLPEGQPVDVVPSWEGMGSSVNIPADGRTYEVTDEAGHGLIARHFAEKPGEQAPDRPNPYWDGI